MDQPVVLLADGPQTRGRVEAELCKRYGTDYLIVTAGSAQEALAALGKLRDGQRQVSLVLAGQRLRDATGTELLARVRQLDPAARRVLLISWGDQASMTAVVQATVLGDLDAYVVRPGTPPDEVFHRSVTEQLGEWARSNLPGIEVVRVVGEEWAARSHELRELLGRNGIPFSFYQPAARKGSACLSRDPGRPCRQ
jgi:thioredoxin reductase (NADPH)